MKFILINDLNTIIKEKKYFLLFFTIFLLLLLGDAFFEINYSIETVKQSLGIYFSNKEVNILYFLYNILFILFIAFKLISNDYEYGLNNIFLRISKFKYYIYKSISLYLYIFIIYIILCFLTIAFNFSFGYNFINLFKYLPYQVLFTIFVINISNIIYILFHKYPILSIFLLIITLILIYFFKLDYSIPLFAYVICILLITIIRCFISYNINSSLFERSILI